MNILGQAFQLAEIDEGIITGTTEVEIHKTSKDNHESSSSYSISETSLQGWVIIKLKLND